MKSATVALVVLLLCTGTFQQSLEVYAHDLARDGCAGESRDNTTGLTNLRARDYDPLTGRFTTADSQSPNGSFTQGYNAYHYTGNSVVVCPATRLGRPVNPFDGYCCAVC